MLNSGLLRSALALPLRSGSGEPRGAFTVFDRQQCVLDERLGKQFQSLADLARLAIEHGQLYEQVVRGWQVELAYRVTEPAHAGRTGYSEEWSTPSARANCLQSVASGLDHFPADQRRAGA